MVAIEPDEHGVMRVTDPKGPWDEGEMVKTRADGQIHPVTHVTEEVQRKIDRLSGRRRWGSATTIRHIMWFYQQLLDRISAGWKYVGPDDTGHGPLVHLIVPAVRPPWYVEELRAWGISFFSAQMWQFLDRIQAESGVIPMRLFDQAAWLYFYLYEKRLEGAQNAFVLIPPEGSQDSIVEGDTLLALTERDFTASQKQLQDPARAWITLVGMFCAAGDAEPLVRLSDGREVSLKYQFAQLFSLFMEQNLDIQFTSLVVPGAEPLNPS